VDKTKASLCETDKGFGERDFATVDLTQIDAFSARRAGAQAYTLLAFRRQGRNQDE